MGVWQGTQPPDKWDTEPSEVMWRMSNAIMMNAPIAIAEALCLFTFILLITLFEIMWFIPRAIVHPSIAVPVVQRGQKIVAHLWKVSQPNLQWAVNYSVLPYCGRHSRSYPPLVVARLSRLVSCPIVV